MYNKIVIVGSLGADVDLRYTNDGTPVAKLRVATNETWRAANGEKQESTEWHSVNVWRKQAEICSQYLQKGSKVLVEGKLKYRKWVDSNGLDRISAEIEATNVQFLSTNQNQTQQQHQYQNQEQNQGRQNNQQRGYNNLPF